MDALEKSPKEIRMKKTWIPALLVLLTLMGCAPEGPVPITFGTDECSHCSMTLTDPRFGAEIVSLKGKAFKFDDIRCLKGFMKAGTLPTSEVAHWYVVDHTTGNGTLVDATTAFYLESDALNSPMAGNIAGFATTQGQADALAALKGKTLTWDQVKP
jgi:copper chaperone NosL